MEHYFEVGDALTSRSSFALPWWDGPMSILIGGVMLLMTGLFVSTLIGDEIITFELKKEKKMVEDSEKEEEKTAKEIRALNRRLASIEKLLKK
jgi:hypothetical protein